MSILRLLFLVALVCALISAYGQDDLDRDLVPKSAEQRVTGAVKTPDLTVVQLWAPWCSNCQAEMKSGGWTKMVKDNPNVRFVFVSVWNGGDAGAPMLKKFELAGAANVTIVADTGPRTGDDKLKRFLDL